MAGFAASGVGPSQLIGDSETRTRTLVPWAGSELQLGHTVS